MEYNRLVFMSPIDEEDDQSLNFGDLSTSAIQNGKENSPMEKSAIQGLQAPVFMDPRIEPTLLEDHVKSYNNHHKKNSAMETNSPRGLQAPVFMDRRIEPTLLEDFEESYNEQLKQERKGSSFMFCLSTSAIQNDKENSSMEKNAIHGLQAPVFMDPRIEPMLLEEMEKEREEKQRIGFSLEETKGKFLLELGDKQRTIERLQAALSSAEKNFEKLESEKMEMERKFGQEFLLELDEKQRTIDRLQAKLSSAETEIDSFDQLEEEMRAENFKLQKEVLKIKVKFGQITIDTAFKTLGCCDKEILEEIKSAAYL